MEYFLCLFIFFGFNFMIYDFNDFIGILIFKKKLFRKENIKRRKDLNIFKLVLWFIFVLFLSFIGRS